MQAFRRFRRCWLLVLRSSLVLGLAVLALATVRLRKPGLGPKRLMFRTGKFSGTKALVLLTFTLQPLSCFGQVVAVAPVAQTQAAQTQAAGSAAAVPVDPPAANAPTVAVVPAVTVKQVDALRERFESSQDLDEPGKATIKELLDQAALDLHAAETATSETEALQAGIDSVESQVKSGEELIGRPHQDDPPLDAGLSVSQLQQSLVEMQDSLSEAEKKVALATSEPSRRQARGLAIPDEQVALEETLAAARKQIAAHRDVDASTLLADARLLRLRAQEQYVRAQLDHLQKETIAYKATADLLPIQLQLAENDVLIFRDRVKTLQESLAAGRQEQIATLRSRVATAAEFAPPELSDVAAENVRMLDLYEARTVRSKQVADLLAQAQKTLEEVKRREQTTIERVQAVGLTEALALLLQREKSQLLRLRSKVKPDANLRTEISDLQVATFELADQTTASPGAELDGGVPQKIDPRKISHSDLLDLQAEILRKLVPAGSTLFQDLVSLDTADRQLRAAIGRYLVFVEEKLLWTRNAPFVAFSSPGASVRGVSWLFSVSHWRSIPPAVADGFRRNPVLVGCFFLLLVALTLGRPRLRQIVASQSIDAQRSNCVKNAPTLRAAFATTMLAVPVPLALAVLGWLIGSSQVNQEFLSSLGAGLIASATFLIPFLFLRQICRSKGLAIAHFRWPQPACKRLRQGCGVVATVAGPLVLIAVTYHVQSDDAVTDSIGRYVVVALLAVLLGETHQLLRPKSRWMGSAGSRSLVFRYARVVYVAAMLVPIATALLIIIGYEYMCFAIMWHATLTFIALLAIVVAQSIAVRMLLIRRRRVTIEQRAHRRESAHDTDVAVSTGIDVSASQDDLGSVSQQAQQLVRLLAVVTGLVAIGLIWSELLPALRMLDQVVLWYVGTSRLVEVSVRDLIIALLVFAGTAYAVKSLPALVELYLLQPLTPGARYAVTTIFRYIVGAVGLIAGLNLLSIPWSQLSWIVAAASVGLGFGLQEILANFVCGIILLLEQPIRVGDIVTVGDSTGVVTKIQIRATTVTNWDRQELIIPNKDLVTEKLLNWTLSNVINRVVIHVGVAYGSDPEAVKRIMLGVIQAHPEILEEPGPMVTFEKFGDSSLNFVIRCYLPTLEKRLSTIHDLHTELARALEAAEIEIPFPQRDIRMTIEPDGSGPHSTAGNLDGLANPSHAEGPSHVEKPSGAEKPGGRKESGRGETEQ